ncbi:MAG TPA: aldo/keto reductase [Kofleriaceae bacterium]|nr:aldo/keto reductase [Kofleriaceae bacterium]
MQYRLLGRTGVKLSRLSFGAMSFGDEADEKTSQQLFQRCLDAGINHFDTADVYSKGRSEEMLGRFIADAGCRDRVVLASKAYFPTGKDVNARGSSRYHLVRAVEASLRRLATDRIDLYYMHRFDDVTALDETLRALDDLVAQGKILYPAASNFAAWQVARALGVAERLSLTPLVCIQPMYNLVKRQAEVELLPMAAAEGVGVISYGPTGGGLLTGKYGVGQRPTGGRLVESKMYATRYADDRNYQAADRFVALARERGHAPVALAVAWVAAHPSVTSVLLGARTVEQLEPTLAAVDIPMDAALRDAISALTEAPPPATDRTEEASEHNFGSR